MAVVTRWPPEAALPRLERGLAALWGVALAAFAAVFAAVAWKTLLYPHEVVVSEGAVRLAVESWTGGRALWDPARLTDPPFVIAHYTPLYYLLTAAVQTLVGPGFLAGRLVSILSILATSCAAGWLVRRLTGRTAAGVAAGALWLSFYSVVFWGTAHRVDAPGILFEAIGIAIYVVAQKERRPGYGAIPWLVAAWATKQVLFVGLLAVLAHRLMDRERGGVRSAATWAALAWGPIFALFYFWIAWSGGGFWTATVLGTVSGAADAPWVIVSNSERFFGSPWNVGTFLAAAAAAWFLPHRRFLGLYLSLGLAAAIALDANFPRFFPPMLAVSILLPLLLEDLRGNARVRIFVLASLLLLAFAHLGWELRPLFGERVLRLDDGNARLAAAAEVAACTTGDRPILAQDVGMLLSAGRPVTVADPLVLSILVGNRAWDTERLAAGIREGAYEAVILNRPVESLDDVEWTTLWMSGPARRALSERYCLAETIEIDGRWVFLEPVRYLYVPRDPADPSRCPEVCR
jgi:hypothetical protein